MAAVSTVRIVSMTISNSIIAGNDNGGSLPADLVGVVGRLDPASAYNLIGDAATAGGLVNGVNGNIVGVDPALVLGPLADNGGPTLTHWRCSSAARRSTPATRHSIPMRSPPRC